MITVHFPTGKMMTIPGANSFVTDDGLRIEFSANGAVSNSRQIKLTKEEKWNALCAWVPRVWKSCKGDLNKISERARVDGFYAAGGGDQQMLWSVMKELGLYPKEGK